MKKDSFLKGTLVASIAIIVAKILGVIYVIPFYKIIGEAGGVLYSYAYNIYNLFLNISTAGIPIALSMIISEYLALNMLDAKERTYKEGKKVIFTISIISFLVLFIFSKQIAIFMTKGIEGASPISHISLVIKAISIALIIVPYLSVLRGYLQGHKFISPGSISQVWEQIIRIIVVIVGSYLAINVFNTSIPTGVAIALTGAFWGALGAYIYLRFKINKNKDLFEKGKQRDGVTNKNIRKKILRYCIPLIIISVTNDLYNIVDMKLIIKGLYMIGMSAETSELIASIICTWAPKICMLISAVSIGLATSLIPHLIEAYTKKDYKESNDIFNRAISTMIVVSVPLTIGIMILSKDIYYMFYGPSEYGPKILALSAVVALWIGTLTVMNTAMQGFKKFNLVIISTIIGLGINAILDIPLILLLNKIGLTPYYGTMISSIIGGTISALIILIYLKKEFKFTYKFIKKNLRRMTLPLIAMIIATLGLSIIIGYKDSRYFYLGKGIILGIIGALTYLSLMYKNKGLELAFGKDTVNKVLKILHLKKVD